MARAVAMFWACLTLPGCVVVQLGVSNPVPGMSTVAVAPFFNVSAERAVDGRRFAEAYFGELQKVPGFEVLPVGVVEQAIYDHKLELTDPADAVRLAQILGVDAVVVGAVTDYSPYYPPRIGLKVAWYSPHPWQFYPGVPVAPGCEPDGPGLLDRLDIRAQSPDADTIEDEAWAALPLSEADASAPSETPPWEQASLDLGSPSPDVAVGDEPVMVPPPPGPPVPQPTAAPLPLVHGAPVPVPNGATQPLMSYARIFDGADANLTAALRDYVALNGDLRSGGWEAYLHRSEDFIRFASHLMIYEMLALHGGETHRRYVLTLKR